MAFSNFGLSPTVLEGVKAMGYVEPTPIQLRAIPLIMSGRDVIGSAQTGTGKTAAFALPILSRLGSGGKGIRALILEPTRELAAQVETAFRDLARFTNIRVAVVFGGVGYGKQLEALRSGVDIIVATPGRLLDHMGEGACKLDQVEFLVLDEADRMLDMGFLPDVRRILDRCPRQRHTSLFSATVPPVIETLIQWAMKNPETVQIGIRRSPADTIKHVVYPVAEAQKTDLLLALLDQVNYDSVIVFCRTKDRADRIGHRLRKSNHSVAILHSESHPARARAGVARISRWPLRGARRDGYCRPRIGHRQRQPRHQLRRAPASRGLCSSHRPDRPAPKSSGDAFTLMIAEDSRHVAAIERFIGRAIERIKLENFEYRYTALFDESSDSRSRSERRVQAVRIRGGYYFGPAKRRKR